MTYKIVQNTGKAIVKLIELRNLIAQTNEENPERLPDFFFSSLEHKIDMIISTLSIDED